MENLIFESKLLKIYFESIIYVILMKKEVKKYYTDINKIYNYILNNKFTNIFLFHNCMIELIILLKNTLFEISNIYSKYVLFPQLEQIYNL
tara:strand:+ start:2697 stop:2969 length:273 start_codon:yes stop_codon:yes gene_type:complete